MYNLLSIIALFIAGVLGNGRPCIPRNFGESSIVCVCNATYCDTTDENGALEEDTFYWYVSSKEGLRLSFSKGKLGRELNPGTVLALDSEEKYQSILGFGGSITDSAGLNVMKLSPGTQEQLLRSYFSPADGSGYSLVRVPIAGCDFSTRPYTYDDHPGDDSLSKFSLAPEDHDYKIPLMKRAKEMNPEMLFLAAAWTAPPWMKTNNDYLGAGFLKGEYYETFARYHVKFLEEYAKQGLNIWAISTGNEPSTGFQSIFRINSMGWLPSKVGEWVADQLGPILAASKYNNTVLLALDDQRFELPWYIDRMFRNKEAEKYISGIAVHWYWDRFFDPTRLDDVHESYPDKFVLMTEACTGTKIYEQAVSLGSWSRGEQYFLNIIENLSHWMVGWIDWNIALDDKGGPNWVDNFVDSPIIVNPEADEFYKQPMYYALKHFSKFVKRGSRRISITSTTDVASIAFATPANEIVVILYNKRRRARNVTIKDVRGNRYIPLELPPYSMHTVIYRQ